jgi:hypothetical protein
MMGCSTAAAMLRAMQRQRQMQQDDTHMLWQNACNMHKPDIWRC